MYIYTIVLLVLICIIFYSMIQDMDLLVKEKAKLLDELKKYRNNGSIEDKPELLNNNKRANYKIRDDLMGKIEKEKFLCEPIKNNYEAINLINSRIEILIENIFNNKLNKNINTDLIKNETIKIIALCLEYIECLSNGVNDVNNDQNNLEG